MPTSITPSSSDVHAAIRSFLLWLLPQGTEVIAAQSNRVPEPASQNFVIFTPLFDKRLSTNLDKYVDVAFMGSIAGTTLTVASILFGTIVLGSTLFGIGVASGTTIVGPPNANGQAGAYVVSPSQIVASRKMAAGNAVLTQAIEFSLQIDVHSSSLTLSTDMARSITTAFRDMNASTYFIENYGGNITPIDADDPRQVPFINDQNQFETRWVITARLQVNASMSIPQQFADQLSVEIQRPADAI